MQVPCDPDQFLDKSELETTICYAGVGLEDATEAEEDTLLCNESYPSDAEEQSAKEQGLHICDHAEIIPEAEEPEHGIPQAEPPVAE